MIYDYNGDCYPIEIVRKNNKNTYIRFKGEKVVVTTGYFTRDREILKLIEGNRLSIDRMIAKARKKEEQEQKNDFYLFGKKYVVEYSELVDKIEVLEDKIFVSSEKVFNKFLDDYIKRVFAKHLEYYYDRYEEQLPSYNLKIRKMKSRWGVCNIVKKNITLNYELYKYDIECLDYVIVHELAHFIEPNHSKNFWEVVKKYCPDYKRIRKSLRS